MSNNVMSRSYHDFLVTLLLLPAPGLAQEARLIVTVFSYNHEDFFPEQTRVPDAQIRVWDARTRTVVATGSTDNDGMVVLEVKPFEHYEIQATREGFISIEANTGSGGQGDCLAHRPDRCHLLRRSLWPVAGDVSVQFRLMLRDIVLPPSSSDNGTTVPVPPKGILTGRVTSTNGLPLRDVSIDPVGVEGIHGNTRTNKDGWYRVSLFPGTYRVMAGSQLSAPLSMLSIPVFTGHEGNEGVMTTVTSRRETRVDIVLVPVSLFNVTVTVIDEIGDVVSGANVRFIGQRNNHFFDGQLPTEADGSVRLGPQVPGDVQLFVRAIKDGRYLSGSMPIRVQDAPVDVTVQLMVSAAISGWVQFIGRLSPLHSDGGLRVFDVAPGSSPAGLSNLDRSGVVSAGGEFVLPASTGERCLGLSGIPSGWRLLDITYNGEDYTSRPFSLATGDHLAGVTIRVEAGAPDSRPRHCWDRGRP